MNKWWDIGAAIIGVAIVLVLVRPSSQAASMITAVSQALTGIVKSATDLGSQ